MSRKLHKNHYNTEDVTEAACRILMAQRVILGFERAPKDGWLDCRHIDFLLMLQNGLFLPLQVKKSKKAALRHCRRYPEIRYVLIVSRDKPFAMAKKVRSIINRVPSLARIPPLKK